MLCFFSTFPRQFSLKRKSGKLDWPCLRGKAQTKVRSLAYSRKEPKAVARNQQLESHCGTSHLLSLGVVDRTLVDSILVFSCVEFWQLNLGTLAISQVSSPVVVDSSAHGTTRHHTTLEEPLTTGLVWTRPSSFRDSGVKDRGFPAKETPSIGEGSPGKSKSLLSVID